jgi:anti-anti-sigma factor
MSVQTGGASVADEGGTWVLWGEIDIAVAQAVREELAATRDGKPKTVDMTRVTFIDSSGLRLVLLGGGDGAARLVGTAPNVREVFTLTGLDQVVEFVENGAGPTS